jgi:hyperosmotically inducible periplasmic protein
MKIITTIISALVFAVLGCATTTYHGAAVRERLAHTSGLSTHDISVDEQRPGVITLNGSVSSEEDRERIERVANDTRGVREVRNNLVVTPSHVAVREGYTTSSNDERAIVSEIMSKMSSSPELRNYDLNVDVVADTVTLRGEVGDERERAVAGRIARDTRGVTSVRNEIRLARSTRSDLRISRNVRESLRRRTNLDLRDLDITTRDGIVTLRGTQSSSREIEHLVSSARMVDGVRGVRNELTLTDGRYSEGYRQMR